MFPIRVVFAGLPPLLESYFCNLFQKRDDMDRVQSYRNCDEMLADLDMTKPEIALICLDEKSVSNQCLERIYKNARLKVIAIDDRARNVYLFLGEASGDTVIDSIRGIADKHLH